jgi:hypothetical protein
MTDDYVINITQALAEQRRFRMSQAIAAEENAAAHPRSASESPKPPARKT